MIIRSVQWNVGGCHVCETGRDPLLQSSYSVLDVQYVIKQLKKLRPDVVTLQEIHGNARSNQAEEIAEALGMEFCISDFFSESHIAPGQNLGLAIMSRFAISDHQAVKFNNPRFSGVWAGSSAIVKSHDKGVTSCTIEAGDYYIAVKTLQRVPMRKFGIDPFSPEGKAVFDDVAARLKDSHTQVLIQGDFNLWKGLPPLSGLIPELVNGGAHELDQPAPTNPTGEWPDRVIYRGLRPVHSEVISDLLTDHFPIIVEFEI